MQGPTQLKWESRGVNLLGLLVQWRPLLDGHEASDLEILLGLLDGHGPAFDVRIRLLAVRMLLLGHDLPSLALHQIRLLEAGRGFLLGPKEDGGLCTHPLC